jgi:endonuclease YncB( thermonuclease family)
VANLSSDGYEHGMLRFRLIFAVALAALSGGASRADPCKAIPDKGAMPAYLSAGRTFRGPVTYVGDGDSLCIGVGQGRDQWVEVRIADFYAPELSAPGGQAAKVTLERIAKGKPAVCRAQKRSHDRVVARCLINGVSVGDQMRRAGVAEGGNGH